MLLIPLATFQTKIALAMVVCYSLTLIFILIVAPFGASAFALLEGARASPAVVAARLDHVNVWFDALAHTQIIVNTSRMSREYLDKSFVLTTKYIMIRNHVV